MRAPLVPVILSGGAGTRLWPASRSHYPKQFLPLLDPQRSLLQQTLGRLTGFDRPEAPIVVCNEVHRFLVAEQLRQAGIEGADIVLESAPRNTAPAIALAALQALSRYDSARLLIMPADHLLEDEAALAMAVEQGRALLDEGYLVTFGITPRSAHTGYGYIRSGQALTHGMAVSEFVEKPDAATAEGYLQAGGYFWNSGMFLVDARALLDALAQHAAAVLEAATLAWQGGCRDLDFIRPDATAFESGPSISLDYAVMEHTERAAVLPLSCGWSDIGAWDAVFEARSGQRDAAGNVTEGDVLLEGTRDSLVISQSRLVATLGLASVIAVETEDAVLLASRDRMQDLKQIVARLEQAERPESRTHSRVYRPWGWYRSMVRGEGFQVKEIMVQPGEALSLQKHHHRAEHWVVVQGTARVTRGDRDDHSMTSLTTTMVAEDESIYLPLGTVHRLENPGRIALRLIEVQTGRYLEEDDIVRFEDRYRRDS
ncbi:mannose-1-phosphate guanylyltransferase/mannose-6-phosphate isomerase [Kushneria aurantia]|uniref:mannose-1-phosphate guanylyltransferase n=1 Tax=Kushneria aurantia TaxID=504092 RepID=A0ABV6FZP3_9GAMM|nr:mannose-1-phosphate guanylyltransferase/mannose-6-phosphate isomerase [Kushneria aurantia]